MKTNFKFLSVLLMLTMFVIASCKKEEEGDEIMMTFKTGSGYTYSDITLQPGQSIKIGITAETEKKKDPLIRFSISESVNGNAANTILTRDIEVTKFEYDFDYTLQDTITGNKHRLNFVIINRDGLSKEKALTITVQ